MNNINLVPVYPEIFLLIAASVILLVDMFVSDKQRHITFILSLIAVVVCAAITLAGFDGSVVYTFHDMFVSDPLSSLLKFFAYLATIVIFIYSRQYIVDRGIVSGAIGGEFYPLALFCLLGQMIMMSANNFLIMYLGLELMSLSLYALIALRRDSKVATEAAMKYFVLGALASGFLLYGISMIYGATGSLEFKYVFKAVMEGSQFGTVLVVGVVFIVAGIAFKLGVVPFHMWVPDVYQGAPTAVTLLISTGPKLAAFAMAFRLLIEGLLVLALDWQQMLIVLAVLSIALGNVAAIAQTNIKRMLAYSTISHMGFVLLGLLSGVVDGGLFPAVNAYSSALFYAVTYVITTLGTFGMIILMSRNGFEAESINDFKGLYKRSPFFALIMMLLMLSLAGIPPLVGFYAKLAVLQAVLVTGQFWIAIVAVIFSLIGAFYYLRIIKVMYFDEPEDVNPIIATIDLRWTLGLNGLIVVALGIFPGPLLTICTQVITSTLTDFLMKIAI